MGCQNIITQDLRREFKSLIEMKSKSKSERWEKDMKI